MGMEHAFVALPRLPDLIRERERGVGGTRSTDCNIRLCCQRSASDRRSRTICEPSPLSFVPPSRLPWRPSRPRRGRAPGVHSPVSGRREGRGSDENVCAPSRPSRERSLPLHRAPQPVVTPFRPVGGDGQLAGQLRQTGRKVPTSRRAGTATRPGASRLPLASAALPRPPGVPRAQIARQVTDTSRSGPYLRDPV